MIWQIFHENDGLDWQSNPSAPIPQSLKKDLQSQSKSKIGRILDFFNHPIQSFQPLDAHLLLYKSSYYKVPEEKRCFILWGLWAYVGYVLIGTTRHQKMDWSIYQLRGPKEMVYL